MNTTTNKQNTAILQGAIDILIEENGWFYRITIDEAMDLIEQDTHEMIVQDDMIQDIATGVWLPEGNYSVEFKPK